jgi:23S rRNA-/tRNA-specific pseudouridylate synthase
VPEKPKKRNAIGFPPPLLGKKPLRFDVLAATEDWLALDKSAGFGTRAHPWDETPDLDGALNVQLEAEKPELQRTGASLFGSAYYLDPEISGVALFAKNRDALTDLRNHFGSADCKFTFHFVAARGSAGASGAAPTQSGSTGEGGQTVAFQADAPLLPHRVKHKMIPSTAKGKKSFTRFKRLAETDKGWVFWQAEVDFFRPHQVRAHAATHGIPVMGDALYDGPVAPTVRQLQPRARRSDSEAPVYQGLAIHLSRAEIPQAEKSLVIESPLPKAFALLLKRLGVEL